MWTDITRKQHAREGQRYSSDLTDAEWAVLEPMLPLRYRPYISHSIEAGVPLTVLAENCGTSVRMIETTYAKLLASKRWEFISMGAPRLFSARSLG